ncbi:recombinase family protein [Bradyrhizobium elkanii]|uniref:recombinase family protein n=1 Tax=Bradyrhizobium elkanii TaxID=29448 RepID=UPI001AE3ACCC|nr:recombinase family protein [Bradyrhizobium elkanii]MBP2427454.1 DNA invertase Pin-like site-specific DNA recombinase [Bradyrhizobium elkanii]MCP1970657.1 DNA invertase Pin-like site-specific DNA recombinase [Bradyrhizobium elkanii]MCS4107836.1 DNA invertase Pin-like site-specific DNA recombinase [Bradyrhizobium elkanii]
MVMPNGSRAAQYVRMSTENQKYSPENQKDAMAAYAARRGLTIVRTYFDEGRSGINIEGRAELRRLIEDVESGNADFQFILVYDVSRWGRFQDVDESAYYEFICKEAGIQIHYCAESFENDGSPSSALQKTVKRIMAGDFIRDLSIRVFIGQSRITRMGFWRGGFPPYGLRRQLVDENGSVRGGLELGQRKCLQTDRIVITHGPDREVETVKRIFNSFVNEQKHEGLIVAELNADRIPTLLGHQWIRRNVTQLLTNERYLGHIIFNQTSAKLGGKARRNPRDMWIRRDNAFPPLVDPAIFQAAQEIIRKRRLERSQRDMLDRLAALREENGYLTTNMIDADPDLPSAETLHRHYGSLMAAYKLIDYQPARFLVQAKLREVRRSRLQIARDEIVDKITNLGGQASLDEAGHIQINDDITVSICGAHANGDRLGRMRWYAKVDRRARSDLTLVLRLSVKNTKVEACYLLPTCELARARCNYLRITERVFVDSCRLASLDEFCEMCLGVRGRAAA